MLRRHGTGYDILFFLAILATLISLAPGLAHLFELPRKMDFSQEVYFTVQQVYSGWSLFGIAIAVQFVTLVLLAWQSASEYYVFRPVMAALLLLIAAQALFWTFTYPANSATQNWTVSPPDWAVLRLRWELSHAAGALCQLAGLLSLIGALFARVRAAGR
ncbi:MAG TPA: hypothetical protein VHC40_11850 [Rhizomicrobium sp.]|jgi:hypothetical protein|nr:hypothetical protein [Rhizomicrobium sp.]